MDATKTTKGTKSGKTNSKSKNAKNNKAVNESINDNVIDVSNEKANENVDEQVNEKVNEQVNEHENANIQLQKQITEEEMDEIFGKNDDDDEETDDHISDLSGENKPKDEYFHELDELIEKLANINKHKLKKMKFNKQDKKDLESKLSLIRLGTEGLTTNFIKMLAGTTAKTIKMNVDGTEKKTNTNHISKRMEEPYPEVLEFMGLPTGSLISRSDVHRAINAYVKKQKELDNEEIFVEGDKNSAHIVGKLVKLFQLIKTQKIARGKMSENDVFPNVISNQTVMGYTTYCFPPIK